MLRFFSSTTRVLVENFERKVPFKPHGQGSRTFENNLPYLPKEKVWEKRGISKDDFFMRKYGNLPQHEKDRLARKNEGRKKQRAYFRNLELQKQQQQREAEKQKKLKPTLNDLKPTLDNTDSKTVLEYVYGTHAVRSVLRARKRGAYTRLYVCNCKDNDLIQEATKMGIRVKFCELNQYLNKLTKNGVHNGIVLETRRLEIPNIVQLGTDSPGTFSISTYENPGDEMPTEKKLDVVRGAKYPLALYLDHITDPQNLGNVIRSAYFFGVDLVVVPRENLARLGSITNKASAGSMDMMPIYEVSNVVDFVDRTRKSGWAVVTTAGRDSPLEMSLRNKFMPASDLAGVLDECPMLLVVGSEGTGVDNAIKQRSDFLVALEKGRRDDNVVDSLNVGVAAGVLIGKAVE